MSAVKQAMSKLDYVVAKLEGSVEGLEQTLAGQQRDMFSAPSASNGNGQHPQGAVMAQRLDNAIEKVEQLLKEG